MGSFVRRVARGGRGASDRGRIEMGKVCDGCQWPLLLLLLLLLLLVTALSTIKVPQADRPRAPRACHRAAAEQSTTAAL